jgi:hypothetical protein
MVELVQHSLGGAPFDNLALRWRRQVGPIFTFWVPSSPLIAVINDPDAIAQVLEVRNYPKSPYYAATEPILGASSMLLTEGEAWREQRTAFNPGFSRWAGGVQPAGRWRGRRHRRLQLETAAPCEPPRLDAAPRAPPARPAARSCAACSLPLCPSRATWWRRCGGLPTAARWSGCTGPP